MGMYDTFNGEQEKVFPWYTYDNFGSEKSGNISGHSGNLESYSNGDNVPYRSLSRNYTKNFCILDVNTLDERQLLHIIENGILIKTICIKSSNSEVDTEEINKYLKNTNNIISRYGEFLNNINSVDDVLKYIKESKDYTKEIDKATVLYHDYIALSLQILSKMKSLKKDKKEYEAAKEELKRNDKIKKRIFEEEVKPKTDRLKEDFCNNWLKNDIKYCLFEEFGGWIEAGIFYLDMMEIYSEKEEKIETYKNEFSDYARDFKEKYNKKVVTTNFLKEYFVWCEITEKEMKKVETLFGLIGGGLNDE